MNELLRADWIESQRAETPGYLRKAPLPFAAGDRSTQAWEETLRWERGVPNPHRTGLSGAART